MTPFEDTWNDVIQKAARGLAPDFKLLSERSGLSPQEINTLFKGTLNKKNLAALAPFLLLDATALLRLAEEMAPLPHRLPEQIRQFTTHYHGMEVHSYLLWSEKNAVTFDTGTDLFSLFQELEKEQLTLRTLFLTHNHGDHVAALEELCAQSGAEVWIGAADVIVGTKPLPPHFSYELDKNIHIEARSTPGHSPGGTTYVIEGLSIPVAIVGDAIFARSVGGISSAAYLEGLQAIKKNILSLPEETLLCAGHGPLTTVGEEKKWNPFVSVHTNGG